MVINGGDVMLFIGGKPIAYATNHSLDITCETRSQDSKDTGGRWRDEDYGIKSWTMSSDNLFADEGAGMTYDDLFDAMVNETVLDVVMCPKMETTDVAPDTGWTASTTSIRYVGSVILTNLTLNAPNGDTATFTASFNGKKALRKEQGTT